MLSETIDLAEELRARGMTLSCAESCTGGLIGGEITSLPGASSFFLGSAVTYSNDAKMKLLGVSRETLEAHGAVSAVTGIAGPGGAVPGKPVGLVYIAVADGPRVVASRNRFEGDREAVRSRTVSAALVMMKDMLDGRL